jgi:hypothetical protein
MGKKVNDGERKMSLRKAVKDVLDSADSLECPPSPQIVSGYAIEALREALAEPYVPMMDDEFGKLYRTLPFNVAPYAWAREIESAVLARLGIEVGK